MAYTAWCSVPRSSHSSATASALFFHLHQKLIFRVVQTSSRPRGIAGGSFTGRRGHTSQLSISDESHHITETIGTLYGDEDDSGPEGGRPLSFVGSSPYHEPTHRPSPRQDQHFIDARRPLTRSLSDQPANAGSVNNDSWDRKKTSTFPVRSSSERNGTYGNGPKSPLSGGLSLREVQADASPFPLTNIDNPNDIAQELSNLQALRRLSMDVGNNIDPDLPPMSFSAMPAIAPSGSDDENDPSRLLWVPARVHPELAPTEFRSFLEKRVQSIRRRSGEASHSGDGNLSRSNSGASLGGSGLSRRSSMLSRQIDNSGGRGAVDYMDGAERLERQKSQSSQQSPELSLDELVRDPAKAVQKLAQESQGQLGSSDGSVDDMPILPMAPGMGLRRSTHTTYRKGGSLRSGERGAFSRRSTQRQQRDESSASGPPPPVDAPPGHGLARVQSEPISDNFSRPSRSVRRQQKFAGKTSDTTTTPDLPTQALAEPRIDASQQSYQDQLTLRQSAKPSQTLNSSIPAAAPSASEMLDRYEPQYSRPYPARSSSQNSPNTRETDHESNAEMQVQEPPARSSRRPPPPSANQSPPSMPSFQQQYTPKPSSSSPNHMHTMNESLGSSASALSAGDATRTDNLTFIPTLSQDERRSEKKSKKDRDDDASSVSSSKSGSAWKWFKGGTDDKDKRKDDGKKSKMKAVVEKAQENVRLDVIQNSIDKPSPKGRESLVLERESMDSKLQEERKKESNRKSDTKKEKDGNIFSSIFGGSKKKEEKEKGGKKAQHLQVPEEPPYKPMEPDVDYHWTRFPLLEERAIYRMAHIKLANPRRPLLSQVLLSNFMYSYLAIVQAMHPQMNVPMSPQQKRLEEEARRKQQEEEYLAQQQMQEGHDGQNNFDQYNFDYHRVSQREYSPQSITND